MRTDLLSDPVPGLAEVLAVVEGFDAALRDGVGRPGPALAAALDSVAGAVSGSPLATVVAEAATRAAAGTADETHLLALAAARSALLGSAHDALVARVDEVTARPRAAHTAVAVPDAASPPNLLAAARAWLADLARAGWRGLDHDLVAGAEPVVTALLAEPGLRRLAVLLDGFAGELDALSPGTLVDRFPERRLADLWARAILLTQPGFGLPPAEGAVSGRLLPLGVDLTEHPGAAQARIHFVLEPDDGSGPRLVRATVSAAKPNTVVGAGVWKLLVPHSSALAAAAGNRSIEVEGMPATADGDLWWDDTRARPGDPADPFATARVVLQGAAAGAVPPLDRHPVALAEPVFLEGYAVTTDDDGMTFELPGHHLAVDADRVPAAGPLTATALAGSTACIGLLRWDAGRFRLQPLAVEHTVRRATVAAHAAAWAAGTTDKEGATGDKAADAALATLRERAGKLLRA